MRPGSGGAGVGEWSRTLPGGLQPQKNRGHRPGRWGPHPALARTSPLILRGGGIAQGAGGRTQRSLGLAPIVNVGGRGALIHTRGLEVRFGTASLRAPPRHENDSSLLAIASKPANVRHDVVSLIVIVKPTGRLVTCSECLRPRRVFRSTSSDDEKHLIAIDFWKS